MTADSEHAWDEDNGGGSAPLDRSAALVLRERRVKSQFWAKVRAALAQIPFADDVVAAYYCAMDKTTPAHVRYVLLGALLYFIAPIDAVPDVIAGLGYTDDAAVLAGVLQVLGSHIRPEHRARAEAAVRAARNA